LALLCILPVAFAGKGKETLRWAPTWQAAVEEARARNVPIVIHRHGFY
jgi:hypothetical protein